MAVRCSQHTLKRVAGGGPAVDVQAHADVVKVVDSPAGPFEGEDKPAAGGAIDNDPGFERMGRFEHPQRCLAGGIENEANRSAAGTVEEVCAQEELMFSGDARRGRQRDVAEGCRGDLNLADRNAIAAAERSLDAATALQ